MRSVESQPVKEATLQNQTYIKQGTSLIRYVACRCPRL